LALALILVPKFGIVGAAIGTAVPMLFVKGIVLPIYVCRTIGLPVQVYYFEIGKIVLPAAIVSAVCAAAIPLKEIQHLSSILVIGAGYSAIMIVTSMLALPRTDKASIVNAIGRGRIRKLPGGQTLLGSIGQ
jgi:hypothetical protein